ncbi:MAG: uL22 family ribosomal protein [Candidatus Aenigmatarchaeota archaeon]
MHKYSLQLNPKNSVKVTGRAVRISQKNAVILCDQLRGKSLKKGKTFLKNLVDQKESLKGRYYTNTAKELLNLLSSGESNAEFKGLDIERLIIHASASKSFTFYRPRSFKSGRTRRKMANVQVVLQER